MQIAILLECRIGCCPVTQVRKIVSDADMFSDDIFELTIYENV